ncbi:peptide-methionine (S)-S-oxide reductase MsrA [Dokdonia sp.]|uniref:peptide-methionine (S)-S-oxide reductase MsrA n=1 Tax=Dokdonia sp. TaxID=2024995 RepID=UPI0032640C57
MHTKLVTFGGGCFWCNEAIFQEVKGVIEVTSGYSGGTTDHHPSYEEVCSGTTGHAEVIQVIYDAHVILFEELLVIFMTTHNPTLLNEEEAKQETQYRSIIFYENTREKAIIDLVLSEYQTFFDRPIRTEVKKQECFFKAEEEHQEYYKSNKESRYSIAVIEPKLVKFRRRHNTKVKSIT